MARQKISDEKWAQARARWEAEPKLNFADIGEMLGVSKQAVQLQAKKNGWVKRLGMDAIVSRAHAIADKAIEQDSVGEPTQGVPLVAGGSKKPALPEPKFEAGSPPEKLAAAAEDASIAARAELISRHRKETNNARALLYGAMRTKLYEDAKTAKAVIEGMKILQETERKAWGIEGSDDDKAVRVVIERGGRRAS